MPQIIPHGTDINEKVDAWIERWKKSRKEGRRKGNFEREGARVKKIPVRNQNRKGCSIIG
jgi:hypothetical protein